MANRSGQDCKASNLTRFCTLTNLDAASTTEATGREFMEPKSTATTYRSKP